jgi:hypothetical protein
MGKQRAGLRSVLRRTPGKIIVKILQWFDHLLVAISVAAVAILMIHICISVTGRYLLNSPVPVDLVQSILGFVDGSAVATQSEEDRILEAEL